MYVHWYFEEYLLGLYRIRLSHIFEISSISNEKPSISREMASISTKNLGFQSKCEVFRIRNFEILGFSHLEFEILGISSEIPSISKKV